MRQIPKSVLEKLRHPDHNERSAAVFALDRINHPDKLHILIQTLQIETDFYVREDITYAIMRMDKLAVPLLVDLLKDERADIRHHAVHVLGKIGHPSAVIPLTEALNDHSSLVVIKAAFALQQINDVTAIPALLQLLSHENREVQTTLMTVLQHFGKPVVVPLIQFAESEAWQVRELVADSLGVIADETAIPTLITLLQDDNWRVRFAAATALGHIKSEAAINALHELKDEHDTRVSTLINRLLKDNQIVPSKPSAMDEYHYMTFTDTSECSAFIAALSHFLHKPEGTHYRLHSASFEIWSCTRNSKGSVDLYLSADALQATKVAFGTPPVIDRCRGDLLNSDCFFVMGRQGVGNWGMDNAKRHLLKAMLGR